MEKSESEIKLKISLDEKQVPNKISWESSANEEGPREVASMFLSLWDSKDKNTFYQHIKSEHNEFHYIYFITYLKEKNSLDLTSMETFVLDCIERGKVSWFPINK